MSRRLTWSICLFAILLSGCFEMVEEVTYKDASSGDYMLTMNCSKSKTRLKTLMTLDSFLGVKIPNQARINAYFNAAVNAIKKTEGITKVTSTRDFENFIFTVSFTFDKTEHLDKAINEAAKACTRKKTLPYFNVFGMSSTAFTRYQTPGDSMAKRAKNNPNLKLLAGATVVSIYRFPKEVKSVSNSKAKISPNKKAVMLKQDIIDIISTPSIFTNTITFQ